MQKPSSLLYICTFKMKSNLGTKTCVIANFNSSKYYRGKKLKTYKERPHLVFIELFLRRSPAQGDHFWMVRRVVVLYRLDCIFSKQHTTISSLFRKMHLKLLTRVSPPVFSSNIFFAQNVYYITDTLWNVLLKKIYGETTTRKCFYEKFYCRNDR